MEKKILKLHTQGLTSRKIAKKLGCHHGTVGKWLKKNNLTGNGHCRGFLERIDKDHIKCSKCKIIKKDREFLYNRKGQKYEYQFTYCLECRRKQLNDNLNSDVKKFLADRYNRIKLRAKKNKIKFNLSKKEFINIYDKQKGLCFYTDIKMFCRVGQGKKRHSMSIDKIIPEKGYVKGNVVFCSNQVNTSKTDFSLEEIEKWMPLWYERIKNYLNN